MDPKPQVARLCPEIETNPLRGRHPDANHVSLAGQNQNRRSDGSRLEFGHCAHYACSREHTIPAGLPGLNILPELESGKAIDRERIFGESFAHDIADIDTPEKSLLFRWCIEGDWKLLLTYDGEVNRYKSTHPREEKRPQLFNLKEDPWESKNLAKENPDIVRKLSTAIADWYPTKERKVLTTFE